MRNLKSNWWKQREGDFLDGTDDAGLYVELPWMISVDHCPWLSISDIATTGMRNVWTFIRVIHLSTSLYTLYGFLSPSLPASHKGYPTLHSAVHSVHTGPSVPSKLIFFRNYSLTLSHTIFIFTQKPTLGSRRLLPIFFFFQLPVVAGDSFVSHHRRHQPRSFVLSSKPEHPLSWSGLQPWYFLDFFRSLVIWRSYAKEPPRWSVQYGLKCS